MVENNKKKLLEVRGLTMDFGGLRAVDNVGLDIFAGEIVALIGPNGAGKTTFFNCVTGIYEPTSGDILIHPPGKATRRINGMKPNSITTLGMARTFQNIRLFPAMTVLENVMIGRHCRTSTSILDAILCSPRSRREERETIVFAHRDNFCMTEVVGGVTLAPGAVALAATRQKFFLPDNVSAEFKLKSSSARRFLEHMNAGWCDPWWHGSALTLRP